MKKMEKEFQELLLTKTEGRMLEQLTVSCLGTIVIALCNIYNVI